MLYYTIFYYVILYYVYSIISALRACLAHASHSAPAKRVPSAAVTQSFFLAGSSGNCLNLCSSEMYVSLEDAVPIKLGTRYAGAECLGHQHYHYSYYYHYYIRFATPGLRNKIPA